jgi:hypothetical protein
MGVHRVTALECESHKSLPTAERFADAAERIHNEFARQGKVAEEELMQRSAQAELQPEAAYQLTTKATLISEVALVGPDAALTAIQWQVALGIHPRVLRSLPVFEESIGERVILGWDVGISLEAAVRGLRCTQMAGRKRSRTHTCRNVRESSPSL